MKHTRLFAALGLFCGASLLGGCVGSSSSSSSLDLEQRVQQQDSQLRQLQPAQAEMWNQVQALRQEVNSLKGQVYDLQQVGGARAVVERLNKHDAALRQVETSMALNLNLGDPLPALPAASATPPAASVPAAAPADSGWGQAAAQPATSAATGETWGQASPVAAGGAAAAGATAAVDQSSTWGQPTPQPQAPAPQKDVSMALYDAGINAFTNRKYDEAQRSFSDFVKNYPNHTMTAEAQYHLAECYFQRNQFADAALAYDTVITKYGNSSRAPGAYLKQGICFSKMKQAPAAKARMQELIKKYPNSPEAARAKTFLKTNK
ncbi:MAG TPA: tol-pal system protein YbgF [Candidatus Desulfovibrio intestinavium]|uniref:Tol-pal system protein YbgF n=2 Tax=Desulfovibrio TaxID=872 RepID=A0A9D2HPI5_9BACT|nr:tol-pal system protein YbgF [Candidatus Desulfovibrio intestinavium]